MSVSPELGDKEKLRQEDHEFKSSQSYIARSCFKRAWGSLHVNQIKTSETSLGMEERKRNLGNGLHLTKIYKDSISHLTVSLNKFVVCVCVHVHECAHTCVCMSVGVHICVCALCECVHMCECVHFLICLEGRVVFSSCFISLRVA